MGPRYDQAPADGMTRILEDAWGPWVGLAGVSVLFTAGGPSVVVPPRSSQCPPEWVGVVVLDL
jgi:hypothetical protein